MFWYLFKEYSLASRENLDVEMVERVNVFLYIVRVRSIERIAEPGEGF